jgi:hypothetical protein
MMTVPFIFKHEPSGQHVIVHYPEETDRHPAPGGLLLMRRMVWTCVKPWEGEDTRNYVNIDELVDEAFTESEARAMQRATKGF